jgi:hypothetical protein
MSNASILSYEIFNPQNEEYSAFDFPGLSDVPESCKEPKNCRVTCYTFRESTDTEKLRKDLETAISNLGYLTKDRFEKSYDSKSKKVDAMVFKNMINPFDKNKNRDQKLVSAGLVALYASPFVLLPASFFVNSTLLDHAAIYTAGADIFGEIFRRISLITNKEEMKKMRTKFNDSHREFFCELENVAPKIEVDTAHVEEAKRFVETVRNFQFVDVNLEKERARLSVNHRRVNAELFRIYDKYASQAKT